MPSFIYDSQPEGRSGKPTLARMISQQQSQDMSAPSFHQTINTRSRPVEATEAPRLSLFKRFKSSIINSMPLDGIPSWLSTAALASLMGVTIALIIALVVDRFVFVSELDASVGQFVYCVHGECSGNDGHVELLSFLGTSRLMAARAFMVAAFIIATIACVVTFFWLIKATATRSSLVLASHAVMLFCLLINLSLWAAMKPSNASYMASYDLVVLAFVGTVFSTMVWSYCEYRRRRTSHHTVVDGHQTEIGIDQPIDESVRPVRLGDTIREISRSGTSTAHVYTLDQMSEFEELEEKQTMTPQHAAEWQQEKKTASEEEITTLASFIEDEEASPIRWKPMHLTVNTGEDLTNNADFMRQLAHSIAVLNNTVGVGSVDVHHADDPNDIDFGPMSMHAVLTIDDVMCFEGSPQSETSSDGDSESSRISMYSSDQHDAECTCSPEHVQLHMKSMLRDADDNTTDRLTYEDPEMAGIVEQVVMNV